MAYTSIDFKTKKSLKEAVKNGEKVTIWQPGPFGPKAQPYDGINTHCVEGPQYPKPHSWYATVKVDENDVIISVK